MSGARPGAARPHGRRTPAVVAAAIVMAVTGLAAAPARATPILDEVDAVELANVLAEATATQGVCYGWAFEVTDPTGQFDGLEAGSNFGPGVPVDPARPECGGGYAVLSGRITYTSELSEADDSAAWQIASSLADPPTVGQLQSLGYTTEDLLGDQDDLAIINATGALPGLVAETGAAEPVPFETSRREPGVSGEPTGSPGSDFLRENGALVAFSTLLVLAGLVWLWRLRGAGRRDFPRPRPAEN